MACPSSRSKVTTHTHSSQEEKRVQADRPSAATSSRRGEPKPPSNGSIATEPEPQQLRRNSTEPRPRRQRERPLVEDLPEASSSTFFNGCSNNCWVHYRHQLVQREFIMWTRGEILIKLFNLIISCLCFVPYIFLTFSNSFLGCLLSKIH